jgi:transcriptional regulator with XRE-family HTH domain
MVKNDLRKIVGKRILTFRTQKGLSQEEFAELMGYKSKSSMISQIENGGTIMSVEQAIKASKILNVHPAALLSDVDVTDEDVQALSDFLLILEDLKNPNREAIKTLIKASVK